MGTVTAAPNPNEPTIQQIGDGNGAAGGGGTVLGVVGDLLGAYGSTTPVAQAFGSGQAGVVAGAAAYGNSAGVVTHYNSATFSPALVAASTVAEQSLTATGTNATDLVFVNPPATYPGLGVAMARVSAAGTVKLVFANATAVAITPTATQSFIMNTVASNLQLSTAISPAAVPANSVVEQTFALTGLQPGMLVQVNKPTTNAGIGLMSARCPANNTLALTFLNSTSGVLTPTSNETYTVAALNQLVSNSNIMEFGILTAGAPATVASQTSVEGVLTEAGILATDIPMGLARGAVLPGLSMATGRILTAAQYTANYVNPSAVVCTPSATEVVKLSVWRNNVTAPMSLFAATITPTSVAANTSAEQTFTVTGITSGQPVAMSSGPAVVGGGVAIAGIRASATNQIAINFFNATATASTPAPFAATVVQFNRTTPTAGNFVQYNVSPLETVLATLLNAMRGVLVGLNLMKGA